MYYTSFRGLENKVIRVIKDANGTNHLEKDFVSYLWLKYNHPTYTPTPAYIDFNDKPRVEIIDCTGLSLPDSVTNNLADFIYK